MRTALAVLCLCLNCALLESHRVCGQGVSAPPLSSAGLLEDVAILKQVFETAHPGLYRYHTKERMDAHFASLRAEFAHDRSLVDAYIAFSQFLAKIQCGHTYANFFNQSKNVVQKLFTGQNRVPFCFRWVGGKMIVTRDLSPESKIKPGTEILAISGIESAEILARLMTIARADGANDAKRAAYLEVQGNGKFEAFDIFLPLFFPKIGEKMELLIREPRSSAPASLTVTAHHGGQRIALAQQNNEPQRGESQPLWKFEQRGAQTAYLRMSSWALYNSKWDWQAFLEKGVDDLIDRRVPSLIIDLRANEGGQDVGNSLIARIAPTEVRYDRFQRYTRYRTWPFPRSFDGYFDTWDWSFKDWGQAAKEDRDGFFRMTRFDDDTKGDLIKPRGRRYEGRVVVLVGATNSSATFQFAQVVKENKLATLVGQTTGGNQRGINGGAFFFVTLPNSGIEVDLPLVGNFIGDERPAGREIPFRSIPDAGIEPDVTVSSSIDDIARGVDSELNAAVALLKAAR